MAKRPKDTNQRAKLIVDLATGEETDPKEEKDTEAAEKGRKGGLKGGKARAIKLTPEQRKKIAKTAANVRWVGKKKGM